MGEKTDWENLFKIKLGNSDEAFQKHEVVKLLVVMKILQKHPKRNWVRIYTEFTLENGLRPDIYFENLREKSVIVYEIQKQLSPEWLKTKTKQYKDYVVPLFLPIDFIPIPLKECPDNLDEISKWLDKYIF